MGTGNFHEGHDRALQMVRLVGGADLDAYSRLPLRNDRIGEANDIDACRQQVSRHLMGEVRIAQHDGDDGMLSRSDLKAGIGHGAPKPARIGGEPVPMRAGARMSKVPSSARRVTRPYPISPPAPVTRTTDLRVIQMAPIRGTPGGRARR